MNFRFGVGGFEDFFGKFDEFGMFFLDGNSFIEGVEGRSWFIGSEVRGVVENFERRRGRSKKFSVGRFGRRYSDGIRGDIIRKRFVNLSDRGVVSDGGSDFFGRGRSIY